MQFHQTTYSNIKVDPAFRRMIQTADSLYYNVVKGMTAQQINSKSVKEKINKIKIYIRDSIQNSHFKEPEITRVENEAYTDLNTMKSGFLIDQIDNAFKVKSTSPLVKALNFKDFCEYVLPYRMLDGNNFIYSGKQLNAFFAKYLGEITPKNISESVARYNTTVNNLRKILGNYPLEERTGFEELFFRKVKGFDCFSISNYGYATLNACGIPVSVTYNIAYKMLEGRHSECAIPAQFGNWTLFSPESSIPLPKTTPFEAYNGWMNLYRIHFSAQKKAPFFLKAENEFIPYDMANPCMEDVSSNSVITISLNLPFEKKTKNHLAYLATFNSATGLVAVTWALIDKKNKSVTFKNTIPNRLYFPIYYENSNERAFSSPFYLKYDSTQKEKYKLLYFDEPTNETPITAILTRKYPKKPTMTEVAANIIGTVIIASNDKKFLQADTLFTIKDTLQPYLQEVSLKNKKAYRYYKIVAPIEHPVMNLSELELLTDKKRGYSNTIPPSPLPVFAPGQALAKSDTKLTRIIQTSIERLKKMKLYDGKVTTSPGASFHSPSVGVSLKAAQVVTALRLAPLNADNGIVPGNTYQLYYWNGQDWQQCAPPITAQYHFLQIDKVPKNRLYWLKNQTEGKEEAPFIIDSITGKQQFIYYDIQ